MEIKSFIAGILTAYGIVNLLAVFKIAIYIAMPIMIGQIDIGNIVLSLLALFLAYLLIRS
jgi:hypothetical protein